MSDEKENNLLGHESDGIKEYDNMLPRWWVNIFYISIIFAAGYLYYYHMGGPGKSQTQIMDEELAAQKVQDAATQKTDVTFTPDDLKGYLGEPSKIAQGKALFAAKCVACHGAQGQGNIGPNLTDDYWIHGGKPEQIAHTIYYGVVDKGMIAWGQLLTKEEVLQLSSYVVSIHGTNPPNPKAPQGVKE